MNENNTQIVFNNFNFGAFTESMFVGLRFLSRLIFRSVEWIGICQKQTNNPQSLHLQMFVPSYLITLGWVKL